MTSNSGHGEINLAYAGSYNDVSIGANGLTCYERRSGRELCRFNSNGITSYEHNNCLATSDGTFKPINDFALKTELPTVPTKVSQLENDSKFITRSEIPESSNNFGYSFFSDCSSYNNSIQLDSELYTKVTIRNSEAETFDITFNNVSDITIGNTSLSFSPTDLEKVIYFNPGIGFVGFETNMGISNVIVKVEYVAENSSIA